MRKIRIKIKTDDLIFNNDKEKKEVFGNHIQACFQLYLQQSKGGLVLAEMRKMNKTLDIIERTEEEGSEFVQLEDEQYNFLKKIYTGVKWLGGIKVVTRIGDNIEAAEEVK